MPATNSKKIVLIKNGSLASVEATDPDVRRMLESTLLYQRLEMDYTPRRGRFGYKAQTRKRIPIECYRYVHDPDKILPPRLMFAAGFIRRVARALKTAGYQVRLRDVRPHPRPEIFEPQWQLLKGVEWRWGQKPAIEILLKHEYGQMQFPTGYGKSWIIRALCQLLPKARFAITTPSLDVIKNISDQLSIHLPCVGICTSKTKRSGNRINCYSMKSLQLCEDEVDVLCPAMCHSSKFHPPNSNKTRVRT